MLLYSNRAEQVNVKEAYKALDAGDYVRAREVCEHAIQADSSDTRVDKTSKDALAVLARKALDSGDYTRARDLCEKAVGTDNDTWINQSDSTKDTLAFLTKEYKTEIYWFGKCRPVHICCSLHE